MKENTLIPILKDLNLTEYESRALVTLFKFSELDAPSISRNSEIPKTRIYDVLNKLKDKGFVLEVYKSPKTFKVLNPNEIFKNLLSVKQKDFTNLSNKVDDILLTTNWNTELSNPQEKILQVDNLKDYNRFLAQEFQSAQKEIFAFTHLDERIDSLKGITGNKNLNVKILTKPMTMVHKLPKNFSVQENNHSMDAFIIDKKKIIMALNNLETPKKAYHLTVLENNSSLVNALLNHFDEYWKK